MSYQITQQTPIALDSNYDAFIRLNKPGDPIKLLTENVSKKLFTSKNTKITYGSNNITPKEISNLLINCSDEKIDPTSETLARDLLSKTVLNFSNQLSIPVRLMYAQMAAEREKMPAPSPTLFYTANSDVIPSCKSYLAGSASSDLVFASFAYTYKPQVLAFGFLNEQEFEGFKQFFSRTYATPLSNKLSSEANGKCRDFALEKLNGLTDNLRLRYDNNDEQDPYSFSRLLILALYQYVNLSANQSFAMPFDLGENYNPKSLIFINIDRHAHATTKEVNSAWHEINESTHNPLKMISNKRLNHLQSIKRINHIIQKKVDSHNKKVGTYKATYRPFSDSKPSPKRTLSNILLILKYMSDVNQSDNIYKTVKHTFNRPNRRHPDNPDLQGKITSTHYKPDIHIYLDTSGSISQENYSAGIKLCIALAKKLDVNLYFNSFSHYLSQTYKLPLKGRSLDQIYTYFDKAIPKVTGGTDFSNVWRYINRSSKRKRELSLLITDFGDSAPSYDFVHPKNLFYLPIDTTNFSSVKHLAERFLDSMIACGHNIRPQILL